MNQTEMKYLHCAFPRMVTKHYSHYTILCFKYSSNYQPWKLSINRWKKKQ